MHNIVCVVTLLFGILFSTSISAFEHTNKYYFTHYTSSNSGLPYNSVNEIVQDKKGFMWFGTSSGLSRFDGTRFRNYSKEDLGLKSAYVISLCTDNEGNVWVGTDLGVTVYNAQKDYFEPFIKKSNIGTTINNKTNVICKGPDGAIWMSVNNQGLFLYEPVSGELTNFFVENKKQTLPVNIRTLHIDANNNLWISLFYNTLFSVNKEHLINNPSHHNREKEFFHNDDVVAIESNSKDINTVYVASVTKGLCELNVVDKTIKILIPSSLGFTPEDIFIDGDKHIWMATTNGVYIYVFSTQTIQKLLNDKQDPFSLSDSHAFSVYIDSSNSLWIGTNIGGVNYSGKFQQNFNKYYSTNDSSLEDCLVRGFANDKSGHIWVTTEKEGLLVYNKSEKTLMKYPSDKIPSAIFTACYADGMLWLGTLKGLYRLNIATGAVRIYETLEHSSKMLDSRVYAIFQTTSGHILVGTTVGLFCYNKAGDMFDPIKGFEGVFITGIDEDSEGVLWVSTYANGLFSYNQTQGKILNRYTYKSDETNSIPSNKLFSVFVDSKGNIWVTSFGAGFGFLDKGTGLFQVYDMAHYDILSTDIYLKIIEDDDGKIWITSDKQLLSLNPTTSEIHKFTVYDGLLNNEFKNCGIKTENGDIYFGSNSGFIRFNPSQFVTDSQLPNLVITDLKIGDDFVTPFTKKSPLTDTNIDECSEIILSPKQNSFGFNFAILNSYSPGLHAVSCKLEGYDEDWKYVTAENSIFYHNVPAGEYILKVKSSNGYGKEDILHPDLTIIVEQEFYKSATAFILYMLFLFLLGGGIFAIFYKRTIAKEKRKRIDYEQKKNAELYKEKLSLFSNIVHEIKTPLTLIRTPLHNIMTSEKSNTANLENLTIIRNSTEYLDRLVKQLLDFVRVEKQRYVLNCKTIDIVECLNFISFNFGETAKDKNIELTFTHEPDSIYISADETAIYKILNNLLDNAVKYTESYITIHAASQNGKVIVSISNDGPIIATEQRTEIFKPFVQYSNDKQVYSQSFGIGLALSKNLAEMHTGSLILGDDITCTTFVLTLPQIEIEEDVQQEQKKDQDNMTEVTLSNPSKPLVLLVEDNLDLSNYLERKLCADYRVLVSNTAEKAYTLLHEYEVDIIITDVALPGMSGVELCQTIASNFELSHIPVIVTSGISEIDTKIACIEAGANIYIEKPFTLEYLQTCIKSILEKRANLKEAYQTPFLNVNSHQFNLRSVDEEFLQKLDDVIMLNIKDPSFSSKQIEEALFLSRSTLIRKVKALLDTTPNNYLRFKRLSIAAELLTQGKHRINTVCFAVGFNSPSYFAKCFKEQFGVLPTDYQIKE